MTEEVLVHETEIELHGDCYQIMVYCRADGRHSARTHLGGNDIIINDGSSLEEVLEKHGNLLPLAITSRKIMQAYRRMPLLARSKLS